MTLSFFTKNRGLPAAAPLPPTLTEQLTSVKIYDVHLMYPKSWQIFINSNKPFLWHDGFMKIDCSASKGNAPQSSISVRWARIDKHTDIDDYIKEVKRQYERKQKKNKKDSFRILKIEPCDQVSHPAYLIHSEIIANHSVYRSLGRSEKLSTLQLTTYCPDTDRLIIISITALEDDFQTNEEYYKKILYSLQCH